MRARKVEVGRDIREVMLGLEGTMERNDGLGKSTLFKLSGGGEGAWNVQQEVGEERSHLHMQELQSSLIAYGCSLLYTLRLVLHEDPW
jgi:hypothetical protein